MSSSNTPTALVVGCGTKYHNHESEITLDRSKATKPDLVGDISDSKLFSKLAQSANRPASLQKSVSGITDFSGRFDSIHFENVDFDRAFSASKITGTVNNCDKLMSPGGRLSITTGATDLSTGQPVDTNTLNAEFSKKNFTNIDIRREGSGLVVTAEKPR